MSTNTQRLRRTLILISSMALATTSVAPSLAAEPAIANDDMYIIGADGYASVDASHGFDLLWGTHGSGDGAVDTPASLAVSPDTGDVYLVDTFNHRIQTFTADGTYLTQWGSSGTGAGQFASPWGIAINEETGDVFVVDTFNHRIQRFAADGTYLTQWGTSGTGDGQFLFPRGIAIDSLGVVYVADANNHRIQTFTADGTYLTQWGTSGTGDGQFNTPFDVAVGMTGNVYVADLSNNRVVVFSRDGTYLSQWGMAGSGDGQFNLPYGVDVDASGSVFVSDTFNARVQKFTADGTYLTQWGTAGAGNGEFDRAYGVAAAPSGMIYVVDSYNHRVQSFTGAGVLGNDYDPDGDVLSAVILRDVDHGSLSLSSDGSFVYTAASGWLGVDTFTYWAIDNQGAGEATVTILGPQSHNPVAHEDAYTVSEDGTLSIGANTSFEWTWGAFGSGEGELDKPRDVAIDNTGAIYVVDSGNNRVQKFNSDGAYLTQWGTSGTGDGQFANPQGIAIDGYNNVLVSDTYNHRIQRFAPDGTYLAQWGTAGAGDGQFNTPIGITIDSTGDIYVVDRGNHRIQAFSGDGAFERAWGAIGNGDGQLFYPKRVAIDSTDTVYVTDTGNDRVQVFSRAGDFARQWGTVGSGNGEFWTVSGIAIDGFDRVHVTDEFLDSIQVFTPEGEYISQFGTGGNGNAQFDQPSAIAIDRTGGSIVADRGNNRIQRLVRGVLGNDYDRDGDVTTAVLDTGVGNGALALSPDGALTYTPTAGWSGTDTFTYHATDGSNDSLIVSVAINVISTSPVTSPDRYEVRQGDTLEVPAHHGFDITWGSIGSGEGDFDSPSSVAVDASGNVYVADRGNDRVQKFDPDGLFVTEWNAGNLLHDPQGIAVHECEVFVVDDLSNRIWKSDCHGDGTTMDSWGGAGTGDGQFNAPRGIATDSGGNVYVADSGNHRIQSFTSDGLYLGELGSAGSDVGEFDLPTDLALDGAGNIYVVDSGNDRIQKFTPAGNHVTQWGTSGTGAGEFTTPLAVAVDVGGRVLVADSGNERVQVFDSAGTFLSEWGTPGSGNGEFAGVTGVAVAAGGTFVYATEAGNHRVQRFISGVLANDYALDRASLTADLVAAPAGGSLTLHPDGAFSYTPNVGFSGDDTFEYLATDGSHDSAATVVTITVANDPPVASEDSYVVVVDSELSVPPDHEFDLAWGDTGSGDSEFAFPYGVEVDDDGNVYVTDGDRIQKFASYGGYLTQWGTNGTGDGQFSGSWGVSFDSTGNVYVADTFNHRIQKFTGDGVYLTQWGTSGTGDGEFMFPRGIGVDAAGFVFVADTNNHRIQKFNGDGTYLAEWGSNGTGPGEFDAPFGVALNTAGDVFVADAGNDRIQVFDDAGTFIFEWGETGTGDGQLDGPYDVSVDSRDSVYVADAYNNRVQKFTTNGNYLTQFGSGGAGEGEFNNPFGIAAAKNSGIVYVADTYNDRVQSFTPAGVLSNDYDAEGAWFTAVLDTDVGHGDLSLGTNGSFTYTPDLGYLGPDSFTYHAAEGNLDSNTATVSINVIPRTPMTCDEPGLDAAIAIGGGPDSFTCDGATVITTSATKIIDKDLILDGGGILTISGNDTHQVFSVGYGAEFEVRNLTITGGSGNRGGAIEAFNGSATITNSVLTGNSANEGGAIAIRCCSVTVQGSSIVGNQATHGGAVFTDDIVPTVLTVTDSTFSSNEATVGSGGAFALDPIGGSGGSVTITNTTISGNSAAIRGGGIRLHDGTLFVSNATITDNFADEGGGVHSSGGTAAYLGSILADNNSNNPGDDCIHSLTTVVSVGYNVTGEGACPQGGPGDIDGVDPLLGPLTDNDGPTETHALLAGSPALDLLPASECSVATDQRGVPRPQGIACDSGAFEAEPLSQILNVEPESNNVWGHQWSAGMVDVSVDGGPSWAVSVSDGSDGQSPGDFSLDLNSASPSWDLAVGDEFTVAHQTEPAEVKTHTATSLTAAFNDSTMTVDGTADPDTDVDVWVHDTAVWRHEIATGGVWSADFGVPGDEAPAEDITILLGPGDDGASNQCDVDGDCTFAGWYVPNPTLSAQEPTEIWSTGEGWIEGATATLTIDDGSGGDPEHTETALIERWGAEPWEVGFNFDTGSFGFHAGATITITDGTTTKTLDVQSGWIDNVDQVADTVSGAGPADTPIWVDAGNHLGGCGFEVFSDSGGAWLADFGGDPCYLDLGPGFGGSAQVFDSDGDSTHWGWAISQPTFHVNLLRNEIDGSQWGWGDVVTVMINGVEAAVVATDGEGNFGTGIGQDIVAGDIVEIADSTDAKAHTVYELQVTNVDVGVDAVSGIGPADVMLHVGIDDWGEINTLVGDDDSDGVPGDGLGEWTAGFDGLFDIVDDTQGHVRGDEYPPPIDDGDHTWINWWVPNPRMQVHLTANSIRGGDWPEAASVSLSVAGKPECDEIQPAGESIDRFAFNVWFALASCRIVPGDVVTLTDTVTTEVHTVRDIVVVNVDVDLDIVEGSNDIGSRVFVYISGDGIQGDAFRNNLRDTPGDWLADFSVLPPPEDGFNLFDIDESTSGVAGAVEPNYNETVVGWSAEPPAALGMLRVMTDPAVPSQVVLDGVPMDTWGLTWVKVPVGDHDVSFTDVQGFTTPTAELVTVVEGATTVVSGSFVERGWLQVTTNPAVAATIYIDGSPMNDWGVWTDLEAGSYEVCFGAVADYTTPACEIAVITAGANTPIEGVYVSEPGAPGPSGHGHLRVTTNPSVPAQILIDGIPRDSWGINWVKLDPGTYEVSYTDIQGFTTPAPESVTITAGETVVIEGIYGERGWLQITTSPPLPGTIYIDGTARNDWGMWTDLPAASYEICFGDVPGWNAPACTTTDVTAGTLTTETGVYTP